MASQGYYCRATSEEAETSVSVVEETLRVD